MPLLTVEDLQVTIGSRRVLDGINLAIEPGSTLALVGESGSGKTMTALALMRLLPEPAVASGRIALLGDDLMQVSEAEMCRRRGSIIGMVFQEPMTALDPLKTIGAQVAETVLAHRRGQRAEAHAMAADALDRAGLDASRVPLRRYPHELSGGERQRVVIAMATVLKPRLVIADEPTSALDVATQAHVLDLLRRLVAEQGAGLLLISHDLAAVAAMADRLAIMRNGVIVETGDAPAIFRALRQPYSRALLAAATYRPPRPLAPPPTAAGASPLLQVEHVARLYPAAGRTAVRAVDDVSFVIRRGENVALVGESGSGKSTLARVVLALDPPASGRVLLNGADFLAARGRAMRTLRRSIQAVFQDPYGSLDPRAKVWRLVAEPLGLDPDKPGRAERRRRVDEALVAVGLSAAAGDKYAHEFSGGERQRLAIARAVITRPALIVLDEPVSALDVSIRAQVLDLLADIAARFAVSYLFISHDLSIVRAIADRVLVMRKGKIVEEGETEQIFARPRDPYTAALVAAAPNLERSIKARETAA